MPPKFLRGHNKGSVSVFTVQCILQLIKNEDQIKVCDEALANASLRYSKKYSRLTDFDALLIDRMVYYKFRVIL